MNVINMTLSSIVSRRDVMMRTVLDHMYMEGM